MSIVFISLMGLVFIWAYCIVEVCTLLNDDMLIEECSQYDLYNDIIDRQKSRRD